jgi:hypothetical protein
MSFAGDRRLSAGFERTKATRAVVIGLLGVLGAGVAGCAGMLIGALASVTFHGPDFDSRVPAGLPQVLGASFAGLFGVFAALMATTIIRSGAWLSGSRLTVRALRTRTVDLTTARSISLRRTSVRLRRPTPARAQTHLDSRIPELVVRTDTGNVRLRLASAERRLLPPDELAALADALSATERPDASEIAGSLRDLADRPRT